MILEEGYIIYFDPFYFKNGNPSKPKYFLVLKNAGDKTVLASLPSSKRYLPSSVEDVEGCVEIPEGCINCFIFIRDSIITENGWSFPKNTYVYGNWIDEFEIELIKDIYPIKGVDYEIIGKMISGKFSLLKKCFINSSSVKRKFKRLLSEG